MVFGLFKSKKDNDLKELKKHIDILLQSKDLLYQRIEILVDNYKYLKSDFERRIKELEGQIKHLSKTVNESPEQYLTKRRILELFEKSIEKDNKNEKKPNTDVIKKKLNTATAILNILKNRKDPLDFNSIKDKIKEYDLKSIDVSEKSIKQSIYNLVYAKKIYRSKKNGKAMYQIRASTGKQ